MFMENCNLIQLGFYCWSCFISHDKTVFNKAKDQIHRVAIFLWNQAQGELTPTDKYCPHHFTTCQLIQWITTRWRGIAMFQSKKSCVTANVKKPITCKLSLQFDCVAWCDRLYELIDPEISTHILDTFPQAWRSRHDALVMLSKNNLKMAALIDTMSKPERILTS